MQNLSDILPLFFVYQNGCLITWVKAVNCHNHLGGAIQVNQANFVTSVAGARQIAWNLLGMVDLETCIEHPNRMEKCREKKMTFSWSLVQRERAMNLSSCRVLSSIAVRNLWLLPVWYYLTNTVHVAVRLFSNRSQITSVFGENKKVTHEVLGVTDVLTTF